MNPNIDDRAIRTVRKKPAMGNHSPHAAKLLPASSAPVLKAARRTVGAKAVAWAVGVARSSAEESLKEGGSSAPSPAEVDMVRHAAEVCLLTAMQDVRHRSPRIEGIAVPTEVSKTLGRAAFEGVPLSCLLRAVWLAGARVSDDPRAVTALWRSGVGAVADSGARLSQAVSEYVSRFSVAMAQAYVSESSRQNHDASPSAVQAVQELLTGAPDDVRAYERALGVDFSGHHLAAVVTGEGEAVGQLRRFAGELVRVLGGSPPLLVPRGSGAVWVWTSWHLPPGKGLAARLLGAVSPPPGVRVALGSVGQGVDGFRSSLLRAETTEKLMQRWTTSWLSEYDDIAVPALLIKDPQEAWSLVQETLGDLAASDPWLAELRETLRLYLAFGRSRVRVAEKLHVSRNTVAYRVQKALQLLRPGLGVEDPLRVLLTLEIARVLSADPAVGA